MPSDSVIRENRPPPPRLAVITWLANQERTIAEFLDRVLAQLGETDALICVFDYTCRDGTMDHVAATADYEHRVKLIWAPECQSVAAGYLRGYREALLLHAQWVMQLAGDLSHAPEQISRFISPMEQGMQMVSGSRYLDGAGPSGPLKPTLLGRGGALLAARLLRTQMTDMSGGMLCLSAPAASYVVEQGFDSDGALFPLEIRYHLHEWNWTEVPVYDGGPIASRHHPTIREALPMLLRLRRSERRGPPASDARQEDS